MTVDEASPDDWMSTADVARRLGVKRETVYSYVSRGLLQAERVGRRSRFRVGDVEKLGRRTNPDVARGDFESEIFDNTDGQLTYRGRPVVTLARESTFEEVAELLWRGVAAGEGEWPGLDDDTRGVLQGSLDYLPEDVLVSDMVKVAVSLVGALDGPGSSYHVPEVVTSARNLLSTVVDTLPIHPDAEVTRAQRFAGVAETLWTRLSPMSPEPDRVRLLDAALILSAEHGLAPSSRVARTAASLGATLYGVVAAGLAAGTNDVEGSSALIVEDLVRGVEATRHSLRGIVDQARLHGRLPGFGHSLYPDGDPRARDLLHQLEEVVPEPAALYSIRTLSRITRERGLPPPNFYFALAALARTFRMRRGATETMFVLGRAAGWAAHAIEEYEQRPDQPSRAD